MQYSHSEIYVDTTGVLLAGGASRRMGQDKACIKVAGEPLYIHALELLRLYFKTVIIAGNRKYLSREGIPVIPDSYPGSALGGLYTGLFTARTDWIFVAPCDMPYPDPRILELLIELRSDSDAVIPRTPNGYEPVFALYHKNCLPHMEIMLRNNQFRIHDFFQRVRARFLDWQKMPTGWERGLLNINTSAQLAELRKERLMCPPIVSIVAKSGTGKTTLLEKLIAELKCRGYKVAAIKHDAHRFDIDYEGKDSWRLTRAGADTMLIMSPEKLAMVKQLSTDEEPSLAEYVSSYCGDADIVLTEGFKKSSMPKIEVHRRARSEKLLCRDEEYDPNLIAVASDSSPEIDVPLFDINNAQGLCDLIVERYLS